MKGLLLGRLIYTLSFKYNYCTERGCFFVSISRSVLPAERTIGQTHTKQECQKPETDTPKAHTEDAAPIPTTPAKPDVATIRSIRMTDETHNSLNEVKTALGAGNMDEALKKMINSFNMSEARELLPER